MTQRFKKMLSQTRSNNSKTMTRGTKSEKNTRQVTDNDLLSFKEVKERFPQLTDNIKTIKDFKEKYKLVIGEHYRKEGKTYFFKHDHLDKLNDKHKADLEKEMEEKIRIIEENATEKREEEHKKIIEIGGKKKEKQNNIKRFDETITECSRKLEKLQEEMQEVNKEMQEVNTEKKEAEKGKHKQEKELKNLEKKREKNIKNVKKIDSDKKIEIIKVKNHYSLRSKTNEKNRKF